MSHLNNQHGIRYKNNLFDIIHILTVRPFSSAYTNRIRFLKKIRAHLNVTKDDLMQKDSNLQ